MIVIAISIFVALVTFARANCELYNDAEVHTIATYIEENPPYLLFRYKTLRNHLFLYNKVNTLYYEEVEQAKNLEIDGETCKIENKVRFIPYKSKTPEPHHYAPSFFPKNYYRVPLCVQNKEKSGIIFYDTKAKKMFKRNPIKKLTKEEFKKPLKEFTKNLEKTVKKYEYELIPRGFFEKHTDFDFEHTFFNNEYISTIVTIKLPKNKVVELMANDEIGRHLRFTHKDSDGFAYVKIGVLSKYPDQNWIISDSSQVGSCAYFDLWYHKKESPLDFRIAVPSQIYSLDADSEPEALSMGDRYYYLEFKKSLKVFGTPPEDIYRAFGR